MANHSPKAGQFIARWSVELYVPSSSRRSWENPSRKDDLDKFHAIAWSCHVFLLLLRVILLDSEDSLQWMKISQVFDLQEKSITLLLFTTKIWTAMHKAQLSAAKIRIIFWNNCISPYFFCYYIEHCSSRGTLNKVCATLARAACYHGYDSSGQVFLCLYFVITLFNEKSW